MLSIKFKNDLIVKNNAIASAWINSPTRLAMLSVMQMLQPGHSADACFHHRNRSD